MPDYKYSADEMKSYGKKVFKRIVKYWKEEIPYIVRYFDGDRYILFGGRWNYTGVLGNVLFFENLDIDNLVMRITLVLDDVEYEGFFYVDVELRVDHNFVSLFSGMVPPQCLGIHPLEVR